MSITDEAMPAIEGLPEIPGLPDPFVFSDGSRVRSANDWERRRAEMKQTVQHYGYGRLPPAKGTMAAVEIVTSQTGSAGSREQQLRLSMGPAGKVGTRLILTIPIGSGPYPAIISGDLGWGRVNPAIVEEVVRRGFLLAEFDRTEIVPDANERTGELRAAYPQDDFGALSAWAWGFHRVIDYLQTRTEVQQQRIIATGHSRGGKAALLAGALDERIALTAPNNSGCMGAGCTRFPHDGETLERITQVFPYWFSPRASQFVARENRLPFDQHSLKALVAPRALLSTEGMEDHWANPPGTQWTHEAARIVYRFLGVPDRIGIVFRPGGHAHSLADWQALLDFADQQLGGLAVERRFDKLPYPASNPDVLAWTAPNGL